MNEHSSFVNRSLNTLTRGLLAASAGALLATSAQGQLAQRPLLVNATGAKPNLMITLDNSGSMASPIPDDYHITVSDNRGGFWRAMRSPEVNPLYYNPRITYLPRVDASGQPLPVKDDTVFVSNQAQSQYSYGLWGTTLAGFKTTPPVVVRPDERPIPDTTGLSELYWVLPWSSIANRVASFFVPVHVKHSAAQVASAAPPPFSYVLCTKQSFLPPPPGWALQYTGGQFCDTGTTVDVTYNGTASIPLPADHQRTDCGPTQCSTQQETANILNWFRYHRDRMSAATTALGRALSDPRLNDRIRVGYFQINESEGTTRLLPGTDINQPLEVRGVRNWRVGSADNRTLYDWLYSTYPILGTPLHNAVDRVAEYLRVPGSAHENPWARNPGALASASNPELGCRRTYNMLFSDGGWTGTTATNVGSDHDNQPGPTFTGVGINGATAPSLAYSPAGSPTELHLYTPYPSAATGSLSDLTARYFWHEDFRKDLDNAVPTAPGQPTFWQNLTSYHIGYMIRPSGAPPWQGGVASTTGLTFEQITRYRREFLETGSAATKPMWSTPSNELFAPSAPNVDDFIQAGYSGGGRSFSVYKTEDLLGVFNSVLADILNASGSDAGVALGSTGALATGTLKNIKVGVDYSTASLTGDVHARVLDANGRPVLQSTDADGNPLTTPRLDLWRASQQIPPHASRRVFSVRNDNTDFELTGDFSALPAEARSRLASGRDAARIPQNSRFVDYLRGKDPVLDTAGNPFRFRASRIGAIVNAPPLFVGNTGDRYYDVSGDVSGKTTYRAYRDQIQNAPASLYVATNAGVVHALSAATGDELAAYMPLRSMSRLLDAARVEAGFSYVLDGPLSVHDVFSGTQWNQVITGTGGRGEKLIYALRSPLNALADRTPSAKDYLWETGPAQIDDAQVVTGHMTNALTAGQTDGDHWVVIANNGHYNGQANGAKAGLVVLNAATGAVIRNIPLPDGYPAGRGLSGVKLVHDARQRIVAAYAGDANGNLWRFNLRGLPSEWHVAYDRPLFSTANGRPIYGAPTWQAHPSGGYIVVFATGMVLEDADLADTLNRERIYGVWDPTGRDGAPATGFSTVKEDDLLIQTIVRSEAVVGGHSYFSLSKNQIDWKKHRGWTLALGHTLAGERALDPIYNLGSSVIVNTTVIGSADGNAPESCSTAGLPPNYLYVLNALDGAGKPAFDTDGDGKLNDVSMVFVGDGGFSRGIGLQLLQSPDSQSTPTPTGTPSTGNPLVPSGQPGCVAASANVHGTALNPFTVGVQCPPNTRPWSRQQYQLTRVPQ